MKTPTSSEQNVNEQAEVIKLGLDIHANQYVVARQIDESSPQSPQRFTPEQFLVWAKKQRHISQMLPKQPRFSKP